MQALRDLQKINDNSAPYLNLTLACIIFSICAEPSMIVIPWSGFLLLKLVTLVNELDLDNSSF